MIETIDSDKLANKVDQTWARLHEGQDSALQIMVQVNTSNEPRKL